MAVKVKPGMYCERCDKPVAAQKTPRRARSSALFVATWGASMGAGGGQWHCPNCGGPVTVAPREKVPSLRETWRELRPPKKEKPKRKPVTIGPQTAHSTKSGRLDASKARKEFRKRHGRKPTAGEWRQILGEGETAEHLQGREQKHHQGPVLESRRSEDGLVRCPACEAVISSASDECHKCKTRVRFVG